MTSGVYKRTPEHCAAISKGQRNSDAMKAKAEAQRGVSLSPEHCANLSKASKGVPKSPEHNAAVSKALMGVPKSPDHCAAISKAQTGIPLSPEHIAAVKKGMEESGVYDKMRGGNDIVDHHYIYDHANPKLYTTKVTRSKHGQIHAWMRKAGIKVPHINDGVGEWRYTNVR